MDMHSVNYTTPFPDEATSQDWTLESFSQNTAVSNPTTKIVIRRPLTLPDHLHDVSVDRVVGVESRGFILAAPVAYRLRAGFVPVRKPGKLPWAVAREEYELEYGRDKLEIHRDAIHPGERILIVDDVLATGGTAAAAGELVRGAGASVAGYLFVIELGFLAGRDKLPGAPVEALIVY